MEKKKKALGFLLLFFVVSTSSNMSLLTELGVITGVKKIK